MQRRQAAFTLIELLVVIAILAVLAGLIFPVVSRVQENSRTVKCANNLRQIGAAMLAFAGDNNGTLPLAGSTITYAPPATRGATLAWTEQLEPYVGLPRDVYLCPSSKISLTDNKTYSYFMGCHAAYFVAKGPAAVRLNLLQVPSRYIMGGDITRNGVFSADDADKDDATQDPVFATTKLPFHNGKANILFADGHVAGFTAFDSTAMTTHYDLKSDNTGYNYSDQ